ncbi:MAG: 23S rRNA (uracil(1939)-C(5))-methyltransferase RlmD [Proteobacteria bacterium]|nr:23S rRNA (uracil(1939)-C(5))-methyltransferase RlmD [Pseudomonadota bacterium]
MEPVTATIENLSHDGRGVARVNGKTVFVSGALPAEIVQFQIVRKRNQFDEAETIEILNPSPHRQQPRCSHFGNCGGCSLQHFDLPEQLGHKQQTLQNLLKYQAKTAPLAWLTPISSPSWGYRRKARLGVKFIAKKNKLVIGFRERQGRLITDCHQCEVLIPAVGKHLNELAELITALSIKDQIPQIEVAAGDNAVALIIRHLADFSSQDFILIKEFAKTRGNDSLRIYLQRHGTDSVQLFYPEQADPLYYVLPRYDLKLEFQPLQFIQINASVNVKMIDLALELLDCQPNDRILDLFCGIGNFSLPIAKRGANVTGVEGDAAAVTQATHNARLNQLSHCEFYCQDLFQKDFSAAWSQRQYDKILLDPPRSGAQNIVESIDRWRPRRIVYISCDLATLARDCVFLQDHHYQLQKAGIMDMFPHTQHAEAIALFELRG